MRPLLPFDLSCFFFFNDTATTEIYTLSLHDALPIPDGQPADPGHGGGVHPGMKERDQRAVGPAHAQCAVAGPRQLHRRGHDSVQRRVEVEIRGETDDDPQQTLHVVAGTQQLIEPGVHTATKVRLPSSATGKSSSSISTCSDTPAPVGDATVSLISTFWRCGFSVRSLWDQML